MQLLTTVTPILNAVSEATTTLSAEKSVSISLVYSCITTLKNYLRLMDKRGIGKFVDDLTMQLEIRFDLSEDVFLTATFLDPRFKSEMFTLAEIQIVKSYLMTSEKKHDLNITMIPAEIQLEVANLSSEANGIFDKMFEHITRNRTLPEKRTLDQQLNFETTAYIEEKMLGCSDCSILYWKNKRNIFPLLSKVTTDFLAVQATNC